MEEIIKRIKDYTFFVIDEKGIIGKATGKFISLNNKNFFEIVTDKKLAGRVFIKIKKENEAEEILNIKLENEIVTFKINFWKENGKIFCLAKELQLEKPSLITDFLGNVLYGNEKWKSIVGQNIFELVENRNALFEAIEKAIEHGEHEKEIFINDRKAKVKIKVNEYLEFYIQEDIFPIIKEIVDSKSKKELLENLKKALDLLHVDYAIKLFDMEFGYRENEIYKFPIYGKGSIVGSILIYDEIDELTKNKIQCISIASSLAVENFEKLEKILQHFAIYKLNNEGIVTYVNEKFEEITGFKFKEIVGKNIKEIAENRKEFFEELKNGEINNFYAKWKVKGKEIIACEHAWKIDGDIIVLIQDVTREKEKEREAEFYNSLLRHDIFNKNEIALGYIGLLEKTNLTKKQKGYLKKIRDAISDSNKLIENIRKAEEIRRSKSELHPINVKEVAENVIESFEEEIAKKGINVSFEIDDVFIEADNLLKEVFANLIKNAIEHANCKNIKIYGEYANNNYIIYVEDDGKGIEKEDISKIFEEGWRKGGGGSGLGLYIVKKLMERYKGKIDVESVIGKGTKFILCFPLHRKKVKGELLKIRF